jgi:hypothetical protein
MIPPVTVADCAVLLAEPPPVPVVLVLASRLKGSGSEYPSEEAELHALKARARAR